MRNDVSPGAWLRPIRWQWHRPVLLFVCFVLAMPAVLVNEIMAKENTAKENIIGGCSIGESALAHGRSDPQAVADIQQYARMYVGNFQKYRNTERRVRAQINELLELEQWTQADIITFTRRQRELLYMSVGKQLATGRITDDELPAFARTIRQRIADIEVELGCDLWPDS